MEILRKGKHEAETSVSHLHQAIMFYFNFREHIVQLHLFEKKKKAQWVLEKCQVLHLSGRVQNNQNVEHPQTGAHRHPCLPEAQH